LLELYARCFAVYYAPYDEDYGFVTLEALKSGKPVVTAQDSGGTLQFIQNEINGLVCAPTEAAIAAAFNRLWTDRQLYLRIAHAARSSADSKTWDEVIAALTSPVAKAVDRSVEEGPVLVNL
jgi:glycosyltransferase involved in cell wall biosynthesis